jgi:DNA-binding NarL/FixJ family response regulator
VLLAALRAVAHGLYVLGPGLEKSRPAVKRARPTEPLTTRERQVLTLLAEARSNKEIGQRLGISEHTAKFHVNAVLAKLGVQRRTEAVIEAAKLGLISI